MPEFILHDDTKEDFLRLAVQSPTARRRILAALEAVSEDEVLLEKLHYRHYRTYGDHDTDVKRWIMAEKLGMAISRFRFFHLEESGYTYRIIYALDDEYDECHILAILRRNEINYDDPDNYFNLRIFRAYQELGI